MTDTIRTLLRSGRPAEAFRLAADGIGSDPTKQQLMLQMLRMKSNVAALQDDKASIREAAQDGNIWMQYAYARLEDVLQPDADSADVMAKYYELAAEAGIADALVYLALAWRDGDFGEADYERCNELLREAAEQHSERALMQRIIDLTEGTRDRQADPRQAADMAEARIAELGDAADPLYHRLLGAADEQLGRTGAAWVDYQQAIRMGDGASCYYLALSEACDEELNVTDHERFRQLMADARQAGAAEGWLEPIFLPGEALSGQALKAYMEEAYRRGNSAACFYLGTLYEVGEYDLPQDYEEAEMWYSRGAILRHAPCYEALSRMILDDRTSADEEAYGYEYAYRALLLDGDTLARTIEGYWRGHLSRHAAAIERLWLPLYEQQLSDSLDEHAIDEDPEDERYSTYPEREIEEDDWTLDPDIDTRWEECCMLLEAAEKAHSERHWEIAGYASRFLDLAGQLTRECTHDLDCLKGINSLLDLLTGHPRLRLRLLGLQDCIISQMDLTDPEDLSILEDIRSEMSELRRCIDLADRGRLDEIGQTGLLKKDPVEWTERFEQVIDEVEQEVDLRLRNEPRGMGFCFVYWPAKTAALAARGVEWRSPHRMNPRVIFD